MQTDNERETQMSFFDQDLWFSKMSRDCFPQTEAKTSESSSKSLSTLPTVTPMFLDCRTDRLGLIAEPLWETDGLSLGDYIIVSFGESPKDAVDCRLSSILEDNLLPKYVLSEKARLGILKRSEVHGRPLPQILREALLGQTSQNNDEIVSYGFDRASLEQGKNAKFNICIEEEIAPPIIAKGVGGVMTTKSEVFEIGNGQAHNTDLQDVCGPLDCMHDQKAIVIKEPKAGKIPIVRRLTPKEAERLQAFPDDWTNIGTWVDSNGKRRKTSDRNRYKALGNSLALPYWQWQAERMVRVLKESGVEHPTMTSLFDGIGGFPLVYQRCGCSPVWASEIEEFCIAVTKYHFPENED